ncbi:nuclear transport factor 2 family protein [Methylocystis sp. ATCC 49242]|uniref:nuclear transport factor 2 family protein n=1 Tax=Methylocystis sp. ATCC 49242 TaxID=622637 RepID=UPI0001F8804B|nr:nuclear transport factor 2 family protein [Methylocystis sp. ATCC 49242]
MHGPGGRRGQNAAAELRRRVHEIIRLRMAGDVASMVRLFVENVELTYNCTKLGLFPAGQWRGRDALRENLRRTDIDYEPLDAEILSVLVEGDRTAVRWLGKWRHRATGQIFRMDMAHFLRWRNGLVAQMSEFVDHHCASRAPDVLIPNFEEMLAPGDPGLDRDEIARRMIELGNFSERGPSVALFREFCAPDVVCEFVGDRASISYAGRHRGMEALANIIRTIGVEFEQLGHAMPEVVVDGDCAAVRRTVEWRHRGTGRLGLVELADFARFRKGLIVEIVEFRDSVALLQMQD